MLVPNKFIELLDNALSAFDHLAKKNNVLRVETVDHYLAVGGILDPEYNARMPFINVNDCKETHFSGLKTRRAGWQRWPWT